MSVKFISQIPYFHLAYRLIPNYPISNQKVFVNGITFSGNCEFITDDSRLIDGLRLYIKRFKEAEKLAVNQNLVGTITCQIIEYTDRK